MKFLYMFLLLALFIIVHAENKTKFTQHFYREAGVFVLRCKKVERIIFKFTLCKVLSVYLQLIKVRLSSVLQVGKTAVGCAKILGDNPCQC